ncbi:unnamed protein product [Allacma fusca]|uniref:Uncharacterized protein n=1 Tax=Allacma fusca TaxID=39272 RepID=A0A8J2J9B3_9HEXA|nr:unnamed protein product [Allacma fusca]
MFTSDGSSVFGGCEGDGFLLFIGEPQLNATTLFPDTYLQQKFEETQDWPLIKVKSFANSHKLQLRDSSPSKFRQG